MNNGCLEMKQQYCSSF